MREATLIILSHQIVCQGMFIIKNRLLRKKLGIPIRGRSREANRSIVFFGIFIFLSVLLSSSGAPIGSVDLITKYNAQIIAIVLLIANLIIGALSLIGLKDSWRIGVSKDQQTDLIQNGIYSFSRNPYFLSYLIMFAAYTILLQNIMLCMLSLVGFKLIHKMVLREELHLIDQHGDKYLHYMQRVPRYIII